MEVDELKSPSTSCFSYLTQGLYVTERTCFNVGLLRAGGIHGVYHLGRGGNSLKYLV